MSTKSKIGNFLYIWDMLNTFFFGYLAKKWKRLIRILSFLGLAFLLLGVANEGFLAWDGVGPEGYLVIVLLYVNLVSLISWVLKAFITNN